MDIIELLKQQHEEARDLLERMMEESDAKEARALLGQIRSALRLHMLIEERIVYPAAGRAFAGDEDDEETVLEAFEEHGVVRRCLEVLEGTVPSDKRFVVRTKVLSEILDRHIDKEEQDFFPELESRLGRDGMQRLGDQTERRMSELEAEVKRRPSAAAAGRSGPRAARSAATRPAQRAGGRRVGRGAARTASGRGAKSRRTTRKVQRRSRGGAPSGNGSRDNNGKKPRRGESTSRS